MFRQQPACRVPSCWLHLLLSSRKSAVWKRFGFARSARCSSRSRRKPRHVGVLTQKLALHTTAFGHCNVFDASTARCVRCQAAAAAKELAEKEKEKLEKARADAKAREKKKAAEVEAKVRCVHVCRCA